MLRRCIAIAAALSSGALWFAAVNAVVLFHAISDPAQAGRIAADGFYVSYLIALAICLVVLVFSGQRMLGAVGVAVAGLLLVWLVPALREHGAGWPFSFASLHASASLAHFVLALSTLGLSWRLLKPEPRSY